MVDSECAWRQRGWPCPYVCMCMCTMIPSLHCSWKEGARLTILAPQNAPKKHSAGVIGVITNDGRHIVVRELVVVLLRRMDERGLVSHQRGTGRDSRRRELDADGGVGGAASNSPRPGARAALRLHRAAAAAATAAAPRLRSTADTATSSSPPPPPSTGHPARLRPGDQPHPGGLPRARLLGDGALAAPSHKAAARCWRAKEQQNTVQCGAWLPHKSIPLPL